MAYSITPLLTGVRIPDQGIMTYQQGYGSRIWLPVWSFLVLTEGCEFIPATDGMEIIPGITVLHSPGHSVGCLSVRIETVEGPAVITGFCCNNKNFPANGPAVCPGVHLDAIAAWESIQRIKQLGGKILPIHELSLTRIG